MSPVRRLALFALFALIALPPAARADAIISPPPPPPVESSPYVVVALVAAVVLAGWLGVRAVLRARLADGT